MMSKNLEKREQFSVAKEDKLTGKEQFILILCGVLIGFINGFFGGGGGMLCVPIFEKLFGLESKKAHATTLCVILPLSLVSSIVYIYSNDINFINLSWVSLGAILGGVIGAFFLTKINNKWLRIIFAVLMFGVGVKMVI